MNIEQSTDGAVMAALNSCQDILQRRHRQHQDNDHILHRASADDDMRFATDFVMYTVGRMDIACRVRSHTYMAKYGDEFTVRSKTRHGSRTEIDKMIDGFGDFIFYGFADLDGAGLAQWMIGDLQVWRDMNAAKSAAGQPFGAQLDNHDGTGFRAFRMKDLPTDFVVCRYDTANGFRYAQEVLF